MLNEHLVPRPAGATPYCMNVFKNRQLCFPTDPTDAISMRVRAPLPGERIAGRRDRGGCWKPQPEIGICRTWMRSVDQQRAPLETSTIMEAKLHAVRSDARKRPRRITFTVSSTTCSLGDSPEEEKLKSYFGPWGIGHEQCA